MTEVETPTQEILNHGHGHFDKWNIFSVYYIQSIIHDEYKSRNIGIYSTPNSMLFFFFIIFLRATHPGSIQKMFINEN